MALLAGNVPILRKRAFDLNAAIMRVIEECQRFENSYTADLTEAQIATRMATIGATASNANAAFQACAAVFTAQEQLNPE